MLSFNSLPDILSLFFSLNCAAKALFVLQYRHHVALLLFLFFVSLDVALLIFLSGGSVVSITSKRFSCVYVYACMCVSVCAYKCVRVCMCVCDEGFFL